jgi:hypothetical protein
VEYVSKHAVISKCEKYRYLLSREWRDPENRDPKHWRSFKDDAGTPYEEPKTCLFVMLNPSTATADLDDPTIRRCVGFARRLKYERLEVVNLFAWRATSPRDILRMSFSTGFDPVGFRNLDYVTSAASNAGLIICAWGAHGSHLGQDETVRGWMAHRPQCALGFTKHGAPAHPLYLPVDAKLVRMPE